MLKTHVIHVNVTNPGQIAQFAELVDKFRIDQQHDVRKVEFFVNPVFGQQAVTMTAIITYVDRVVATEVAMGQLRSQLSADALSTMGDLNKPKVA